MMSFQKKEERVKFVEKEYHRVVEHSVPMFFVTILCYRIFHSNLPFLQVLPSITKNEKVVPQK